ncbi:hypothetical protein BGX20_000290 [Mortierella sp. AD010]|nr:hypothetical protein BGX20_000290 [Mortierella sp. AD010]
MGDKPECLAKPLDLGSSPGNHLRGGKNSEKKINAFTNVFSIKTLMSIRMVGTRISIGNGPAGGILYLFPNWSKSNTSSGVVRAYTSTQTPFIPWIHNRIHQHQLPVASLIRQFSLALPSLSRRAAAAQKVKDQPEDESRRVWIRKPRFLWTLEEDITLYNCIRENKRVVDFYHLFPGRSMDSVLVRAYRLRTASFVPPKMGGPVEKPGMTVTERVEALRRTPRYKASELKEGGVSAAKAKSTNLDYTGTHIRFSEEEKELLVKLVHKYRNTIEMWTKVSGGRLVDEEGAPRLNRTAVSCKSMWEAMNRGTSINIGPWDRYEQRRLEKAIRSQIGDEYEICLDVKVRGSDESNQSATVAPKSTTKLALRVGSPELQELDWNNIASKVRTRKAGQCRVRFFGVMHNGMAGGWTAIETERLLEGYKLHGRQWDKVAAHVEYELRSTRTLGQKTLRICSSNSPTVRISCFLANWNKNANGVARLFASIQPSPLPWNHNRINPRHQLPATSIIRQFSLAPSILSQRAAVAQSDKGQLKPQDKNQYKRNRKGRPRSWTLEEDIILYNTIQDKRVEDFYHQFLGRTVTAVCARAFRL